MIDYPAYFSALTAALFMGIAVVVALVRWFHMCEPYDRDPDYYFPGRRFVFNAFFSSLILIPYIVSPTSTDAWYLSRVFFLPWTLFCFCILIFAYFGTVMQWKLWRRPLHILGGPVLAALLTITVISCWPGDQIGPIFREGMAKFTLYMLGGIMTLACWFSLGVVYFWSQRFQEDDFSNPADFPVIYARRMIVLIGMNLAFAWVGALSENLWVVSVTHLLFCVSSIIFLITSLEPNRHGTPMVPAEQKKQPDTPAHQKAVSAHKREEMLAALKTAVEDGMAYLDPHLTLQNVADRCGYSRTYIAGLVKSEFGGFFNYINNLRLNHVDAYMKEHPKASVQEAATESGFSSRQAYYSVKARLRGEQ